MARQPIINPPDASLTVVLAGGLSTVSACISANVSIASADTYYSGPSIELEPGTYLVTTTVTISA